MSWKEITCLDPAFPQISPASANQAVEGMGRVWRGSAWPFSTVFFNFHIKLLSHCSISPCCILISPSWVLCSPTKLWKQMRKGNHLQSSFRRVPPDHRQQHMETTGKMNPCHEISANFSRKCLGIALKATWNVQDGRTGIHFPPCFKIHARHNRVAEISLPSSPGAE